MPRYGFNFQWMYSTPEMAGPEPPDERALDFLAELGFDSVRIPTDYRFWTQGADYLHPDEGVLRLIDRYVEACRSRRLHLCLNLHRAPGYCINRNDLEVHNLWLDPIAQEGFIFLWEMFARRYADLPNDVLSFDLVNEPPNLGEHGLTRENHAGLVRRTLAAIRAVTPEREIVVDGLAAGTLAMPELADAGVIQSGRGYQPMPVSHHRAWWWAGQATAPEPRYPGVEWEGRVWDCATLRDFYQPWRDVEAQGVNVHIGEFGCYNQTPDPIALRWLGDLLSLYQAFGWGYSLWEFKGPFGIVAHGRPGGVYEAFHGFSVDRTLLDLLLSSRV